MRYDCRTRREMRWAVIDRDFRAPMMAHRNCIGVWVVELLVGHGLEWGETDILSRRENPSGSASRRWLEAVRPGVGVVRVLLGETDASDDAASCNGGDGGGRGRV